MKFARWPDASRIQPARATAAVGGSSVIRPTWSSYPQAEAVAAILNDHLPAPGKVRVDLNEDQARVLFALFRAARDHDVLYDQGVDISPEDIESLASSLEGAVAAATVESEPHPAP